MFDRTDTLKVFTFSLPSSQPFLSPPPLHLLPGHPQKKILHHIIILHLTAIATNTYWPNLSSNINLLLLVFKCIICSCYPFAFIPSLVQKFFAAFTLHTYLQDSPPTFHVSAADTQQHIYQFMIRPYLTISRYHHNFITSQRHKIISALALAALKPEDSIKKI